MQIWYCWNERKVMTVTNWIYGVHDVTYNWSRSTDLKVMTVTGKNKVPDGNIPDTWIADTPKPDFLFHDLQVMAKLSNKIKQCHLIIFSFRLDLSLLIKCTCYTLCFSRRNRKQKQPRNGQISVIQLSDSSLVQVFELWYFWGVLALSILRHSYISSLCTLTSGTLLHLNQTSMKTSTSLNLTVDTGHIIQMEEWYVVKWS